MRKFRLTPFGSRITLIAAAIAAGTTALVYAWAVPIAGHQEAGAPILAAGVLAVLAAFSIGVYFSESVARRVKEIDAAIGKVAEGEFATPIPVDYSGQLGELARAFNEMQRRLAELDAARKRFVANASHELRTPIFSLGGFIELLEDEQLSAAEQAEFLRTMTQQIRRLTKLTADLLDLSQIDAGGVEMEDTNVDLDLLAREVAREFGPRADRRGSRLELRAPQRGTIAYADPKRIRQVVRILLDNALVHTPPGASITVTTYYVNHRAQLTVSDNGPGIPQPAQKRLFERFFTGHNSEGSGLGLAIAQELAHRMRGRMAVSSSRRFTAFTLDLPPELPPGAPPPEPVEVRPAEVFLPRPPRTAPEAGATRAGA